MSRSSRSSNIGNTLNRWGLTFTRGERRVVTASARREMQREREENAEVPPEYVEHHVEHFQHGEPEPVHFQHVEPEHVEAPQIGFPGGPRDTSLLIMYHSHVAASIWTGPDREVLKFHHHGSKLRQWVIPPQDVAQARKDLVRGSPIPTLRNVTFLDVHKPLLSAFVERWHPETNSFHMPFGEMTITLDDVFCITGLPILGRPLLSTRNITLESASPILGMSNDEMIEGMGGRRGASVKLEWLRRRFSEDATSDDLERVTCSTRAYLLYLLGCTIFTDKSGSRVMISYLQWLEDLGQVHTYAWGAATLAYLYRQLGEASRYETKQIAGYFTLLEAWIYLRFPHLSPDHNVGYQNTLPLARMWKPVGNQGTSADRLQAIRENLDILEATDVVWTPYDDTVREHFEFHANSLYHGCIVMGTFVEPYLPDRVLRQFGRVQTIPSIPIAADNPIRNNPRDLTMWIALAAYWHIVESHRLSREQLGRAARYPSECSPDYMDWFVEHSHPRVQNPISRSTRVRGTNPAAADDAEIVRAVRNLTGPMMRRWRSGDRSITYEELVSLVSRVDSVVRGPDEAGPSTSEAGPSTCEAGPSRVVPRRRRQH